MRAPLETLRQNDAEVRAPQPMLFGILVRGAVVPGFGSRHVRELRDSDALGRSSLKDLKFSVDGMECHRVTGAESFIVQVAVRDVRHMEEVIDSMMPYVSTNTSMVLASPVPWNSILPAARYGKKPRPRKGEG